MTFDKATKQELSGLIKKIDELCFPLRVHDINYGHIKSLEDRNMFKSTIAGMSGIQFKEARILNEALRAFKNPPTNNIDKRRMTKGNTTALLDALSSVIKDVPLEYQKRTSLFSPSFLFNDATGLSNFPKDLSRKDSRKNRTISAADMSDLQKQFRATQTLLARNTEINHNGVINLHNQTNKTENTPQHPHLRIVGSNNNDHPDINTHIA